MFGVIRDEVRRLDRSKSSLRKFGIVVGGVFALIGAALAWKAGVFDGWRAGLAVAGGVLVALGLVAPTLLRQVYVVWMAMAFFLGIVMTNVILTIVFVLVLTPIALIFKLLRKDPINRKPDPTLETYWIRKEYSSDGPERLTKYY